MTKTIRVLVIDDSAFVRKTLRELLHTSPYIEVVGTARDGLDGLEKVAELSPDVITLDLIMPHLDGVGFLQKLMQWRPIPTVVVSIASEDGEQALAALDAGAIDMVQKPTALASERLREVGADLVAKVRAAADARPVATIARSSLAPSRRAPRQSTIEMLAIGASTGGPQALRELIPRLPGDLPVPVAVVIHMPVGYTHLFAERLNSVSQLEVVEAQEGMPVMPGRVLVAQAGRHLAFRRTGNEVVCQLEAKPFDTAHKPSVDVLFSSAARVFGGNTLGVILTGMGSDGTEGAGEIRSAGGTVIAESEESCVVYGMPRSAVEAGVVNRLAPLGRMADEIMSAIEGEILK
jgi:two-component system, chemotaxis family, protein-glutamate methylesterase/glutaminase